MDVNGSLIYQHETSTDANGTVVIGGRIANQTFANISRWRNYSQTQVTGYEVSNGQARQACHTGLTGGACTGAPWDCKSYPNYPLNQQNHFECIDA